MSTTQDLAKRIKSLSRSQVKAELANRPKLSFESLRAMFVEARDDHPGRKGK